MLFRCIPCLKQWRNITCFQITLCDRWSFVTRLIPTLITAKGIECSSNEGIEFGENGDHGNFSGR